MDRSTYPVEIAIAILVLVGLVWVGHAVVMKPVPQTGPASMERVTAPRPAGGSTLGPAPDRTGPEMRDLEMPRD